MQLEANLVKLGVIVLAHLALAQMGEGEAMIGYMHRRSAVRGLRMSNIKFLIICFINDENNLKKWIVKFPVVM